MLSERGYDAVTVDELVRRIGTSRATFFRYFEAKEDVVLLTAAPDEHDYAALVEAGLQPGDRPVDAVFRILGETLPRSADQTGRLRARVRMVMAVPALGERLAGRRGARQADFTAALAPVVADPKDAALFAAMAFACLDVAWRSWAHGEGGDLRKIYRATVDRARGLLAP